MMADASEPSSSESKANPQHSMPDRSIVTSNLQTPFLLKYVLNEFFLIADRTKYSEVLAIDVQ